MSEKRRDSGLTMAGKLSGPTSKELATIGDRAMTLESVRKYIGCSNVRRLCVEAPHDKGKGAKPQIPSRFRVTLYDDTNHRAILIEGSLRNPRHVNITESAAPPDVSPKRAGNLQSHDQT
jgi:hypothetical protein